MTFEGEDVLISQSQNVNVDNHALPRTVYTNDNRFVILLSRVYFGDWVTKIWHLGGQKPIIAYISEQYLLKADLVKQYFLNSAVALYI